MLTERQEIYAKFMLNQIGIDNEDFIEKYLQHLERLYGKMISTRTDRYGNDIWRYSTNRCIEVLIEEINLKKNLSQIKQIKKVKNDLNATEISNYSFCPASYSISISFEIDKPNGEEFTEIGNRLHDELLLLKNIERYYGKYDTGYVIEKSGMREEIAEIFESNEKLKKILNSKLIFCGHKNNQKVFINNLNNFRGTPDYIFQDSNSQFFVVEEKFNYIKDLWKDSYFELRYSYFDKERIKRAEEWDNKKITFYKNHVIQTYSYIRNIDEYNIQYGLLIYWFYDFKQNGFPYIHRVEVKKIIPDVSVENDYQQIIDNIRELISKGNQKFDIASLNPFKCAGCVLSKYCAHKTGKLNNLNYPYKINDLKLNYITFPEELKKSYLGSANSDSLPF